MVRLLDACVQALRQRGMKRMYIDAAKRGEAGFQSMGTRLISFTFPMLFRCRFADSFSGFQKWARYRDVWRDV
jgi:hypothetical protein